MEKYVFFYYNEYYYNMFQLDFPATICRVNLNFLQGKFLLESLVEMKLNYFMIILPPEVLKVLPYCKVIIIYSKKSLNKFNQAHSFQRLICSHRLRLSFHFLRLYLKREVSVFQNNLFSLFFLILTS